MVRRLDTEARSTVYLHFRVTPEEEARIKGLAHYKGMSYGAMLRELAEQERKRLWNEEGKRPPVRPPAIDDSQDTGPSTPRKKR